MLCFSARILNVQINIQKYIKNYTICLYHMTTQFLAKLQLVVNCQFLKYRPLCENDIIFLSLRLYVKSKLANLESQNLPIYNHIERQWIFTPFLWMFAPFWRLKFNKSTTFWSQKWLKWQILSDRKLWDFHTECKYLLIRTKIWSQFHDIFCVSRNSIFLWQSLRRKKIQENLSSSSAMVLLDWKCWSRFECWLIWGNQNGIFITAATSNKTITQWYKEVHPKFWNDLPASQMVYNSFMTENSMNSRFEV